MEITPHLDVLLKSALEEDIGSGDITTNLIVDSAQLTTAKINAKEQGILCGVEVVRRLVELYNSEISFTSLKEDGDEVEKGDVVAKLSGSVASLLTIERVVLNFLQRLSGVATNAHLFSQQLVNCKAVLLDTRKTIPGYRMLEKYAVKVGGGSNHRRGLYDMVLVKDNHITIAGSLSNAIERVQKITEQDPNITIEIEVDTLDQLRELLGLAQRGCVVDIVLLDNMSIDEMEVAVELVAGFNQSQEKNIKLEASGGVTLETIKEIGETGVDFISVGGQLTLSARALDLNMEIVL